MASSTTSPIEMYNDVLSMGEGTHEVPLELFALNRRRLVERLKDKVPSNSVVLLEGGDEIPLYDTDASYVFRQESFFMWAFGIVEPGCYGAIDVDSGKSFMFVPKFPDSYSIWMGPVLTLEDFQTKYHVDSVHFIDNIVPVLKELKPTSLLTLSGVNSDSHFSPKEVHFTGIEKFFVDKKVLYDVMSDLRVFKTDYELDVLKYVAKVSSAAHRKVMRMTRPEIPEYKCESTFLHYCYSVGGCRFVSYTCICATGPNNAVLHYGHAGAPNDRCMKDGDMALYDMGANYFGYAADITCSFPVNGRFTADQKIIYNAVLNANRAVMKECMPGVSWVDMHILGQRKLLEGLRDGGLVYGNIDAMMKNQLGAVFQPHGLGHLIGLNVHDVGGYLPSTPPRPTQRGANKLRTARVLEIGMCMTIEPGCYFIDGLLDDALANPILSKFINAGVLERFRGTGGVRIEDDVYITKEGCVNMVKVPRTVEEVEAWMAGKEPDNKYD